MRLRRTNWMVLGLLLAAGAWFLWPQAKRAAAGKFAPPIAGAFHSASTAPQLFPLKSVAKNSGKAVAAAAETNRFAWRLSNTTKSIGELERDGHAILLENALIDTRAKLDFSIPKNLQAQGDPGAYIVQANGAIGPAFRAMLAAAGAQMVSYIPNNACLVRISAGGANALAANPLAQSVIPWEPYYKVQPPLLAFGQTTLPAGALLNLGLFADNAAATIRQIEKLGGSVLSQESEPFGLEVRVRPPPDWTALAQLPGVQIVEENHARELANDLSRVTTGVATNTVTGTNYLGLNGSHVIVAVDDSGIDATHPDFSVTGSAEAPGTVPPSRVIGDAPQSLTDTNGHGTFVGGEIGGNGSESLTITTVPQGSVSNADFRGMAPMATLYSIGGIDGGADTNVISDRYLQESAALTNALISNNSWGYGDNLYDLAAASYDAATRDALMGVTGSQPVLFVFAAGNDGQIGRNGGNGDDAGGGGTPDTITSPGTAKDVIAVGALEQDRGITNTYLPLDSTNPVEAWNAGTDSSSQVADYSGRGNVGIGTEGTFGRFKPDVVAPGSFVISTRSQQWDQQAYYNPTNVYVNDATFQLVDTNAPNYYNFPFVVQNNAVSVSIQILPDDLSPVPFPPDLPIYVSLDNYPDPANPGTYDFETMNESVTIPTDGGAGYLQSIINNLGGFNFAVGDSTNLPVNYDLVAEMVTTNDLGDYYTVLSNLNGTLGPWYRYESGTSMAAADVSGVLALMQDFFTNTLHLRPSPALLKAMLINGARPTGYYNLQVDNNLNLEGWGLVNLPNSIPLSLTNAAANTTLFFVDQSPTNELATGDSRTYNLSLSPGATAVPLRLTLAWTDPPGNPAAAIKLVNNLDLIVTNTDNNANPVVYYGNDIGPNQVFNTPENSTNAAPNLDDINNVENVFLPADAGTNFTVVIRGTAVNVNAVTANTNNIVQDFALVVSSGNGSNTNGFAVTGSSLVSNPTGGQRITVITATNAAPLMNQFAGAGSPLPGTNVLLLTGNTSQGFGNDWQVALGQTNQWHFYVATNYGAAADFTNAAFVTFLPPTAAVPRAGVFADSDANSTRPEADLDLYVTTDSNLLILSPVTISNCVNGTQVGASSPGGVNGVFNGAALDRGGSEFVVDTNSTPGQVYYVGVKSEDQMAAEYAFLPEFSNLPFSSLDNNGDESATFYPVEIPDGDATHPGYTNSLALTIFPVEIQRVVVTNTLTQQNAGDLVVSVDHSTVANGDGSVVLINHDSPATFGTYTTIYDDSGENDIAGSQPSDGPGSLNAFAGQEGMGVWLLHASDNAPSFVGSEQGSLYLQRHQPLQNGGTNTVAPGGWYFDYIDVPAGATNLAINVTNITPSPDLFNPLQLFIKFGSQPATNDFDKMTVINNGAPPSGSLTVSLADAPPLRPGRYYVGVFNPSASAQTFTIFATILPPSPRGTTVDFASAGPVPLPDDAVTVSSNSIISITNGDPRVTGPVASVNVGIVVRHPRISDLVFTLISPGGQRILLMENRGGTSTNGAGGGPTIVTNTVLSSGFEGQNGDYTNGQSVAGWNVASGQVSVVTDPANAHQGSNFLALANGTISASVPTTVGQTYTLSFAYRGPGIVGWWRGENNTLDSVGGNNGSWNGTSGYSSGEVGQAFNFNGANYVQVPDAPALYFTNAMTVEAWINLRTFSGANSREIVSKLGGPNFNEATFTFSIDPALKTAYFIVEAANGSTSGTVRGSTTIPTNQWVHLAGVCDGSTLKIYFNGRLDGSIPWTQGIFPGDNPLVIGCTLQSPNPTSFFNGGIDEASLYNRALSSSEIAAIYTDGIAGKFDPFASSIVTGLAKAQVTVNGSNAPAFFGNNTNWQTTNITFTATQSTTAIQFAGMEPGMLLDNVSVTNVATNYEYLTFTEDTNLTTTPIKFAVPPFTNTSGYFSSQSQILYTNGFEGSVGSEWSNPQTDVTPIGSRRFLGQFGPGTVTLSLNNLPVHTNLTLGFDFFQIRSWDGNYNLDPAVGPDFWTLQVAGSPAPLLYTTFICAADTAAGYYQSYPSNYPASFPAYTGAIETNTLGYNDPPNNINPDNAVYRMHYSFAHTNGSIQVQFIGGETQDVTDESWGLDNVFVDANVLIPGLYYLPEQSLDSLDGLNAQGDWTLEVQDDRAGAYDSNNPPELVSWELQFVFADTNAIPAVAGGGLGQTNFVGAGGIAWYQINVPTNANYATNLLLFASAPVNVWFSTNSPPTITNTPNDQILIPIATSGSVLLSTNSSPFIVPGSTYYLGVQNPDNAAVNYGIEVDFDHGNSTNSTLPQLIISKVVQTGGGKIQFQWTASSGAQVEVQWTTNLAQAWNTITNPATTTSNGVSTFTDDGSQTAPLGGMRFYRLVQPSP